MYGMAAGWESDSTNLEGLTTMPNSAQKFYAKSKALGLNVGCQSIRQTAYAFLGNFVRTSRQMRNSAAFANNDVITIAWSYGKRPDACMGFALYRIDAKGKETVLPSHAVFPGEEIKPGQTTAQFPVQKFYWKDPFARSPAFSGGLRGVEAFTLPSTN
jgi:hypothetical protein